MPKLIILGTASAVPDEHHDNTHMAIQGNDRLVLIDGATNPVIRLKKVGLNHSQVTDIITSHFHPDHVSGIPLLLMGMGLSKRKKHLTMHGLSHTVGFLKQLLDNFAWDTWHDFEVTFNIIPENEMTTLLETDEFRILTNTVKHFIPTLGFRFEFINSGKVVAYSCDTAPNRNLINLAKNADILFHEAAGASYGHSSAAQAGRTAREANVRELYLIHYPIDGIDLQALTEEAAEEFGSPVKLAKDYLTLDFI
jgi:ribonuclease Z